MTDQTVAFANSAVLNLAGSGEFEAFLHTTLGLELGHFGLLWLSPYQADMAALLASPLIRKSAPITRFAAIASDSADG